MAEVYSISMPKGGAGKTSLVTNLASILAKDYDKKVLIIDIDGQGNSSVAFGKNPYEYENTIYDVMLGDVEAKDTIQSMRENIDLLPANEDMYFVEFDVLPHFDKYTRPNYLLKDAMEGVGDDYDYIFIDTPPSLGFVAGNCLTYAEHVIIPFVPDMFDVRGLTRVVKAISDFRNKYNPSLNIAGVLGMKVEATTQLHSLMLQEARQYCDREGIPMYETVIPKSITFAKAVAYNGLPAVLSPESKNKLVKSYEGLAEEFLRIDDKKKKEKSVKDASANILSIFEEKSKRKTVEETHKRTTFLFRTDLQERLDKLAEGKRGFKTFFLNEVIEAALDNIKDIEEEDEKQ